MPTADTTFVIDLMRQDAGALARYREYELQGIGLATTGITAMELYKGAFVSGNEKNRIKVATLLELFIVLTVDETIYETFGRLSASLARGGNAIGDFDEVIAAIALSYDGEIITRDRHFEKVPNLAVLSY